MSLYNLIHLPNVFKILLAYVGIAIIDMSFSEALPLWGMSSYSKGGLELTTSQIGNIMSITGLVLVVFTLTVYPLLANYLGVIKSFLLGQFVIGLMVLTFPIYSSILHSSSMNMAINNTSQWVCVGLLICCKFGTNMAFSSISLAINQSVPTNKRASVNGIAMTLGSAAKGAGPIISSIIFAWSINNNLSFPFNYYFVFIITAITSIINVIFFASIFREKLFPSTTPLAVPTISITNNNNNNNNNNNGSSNNNEDYEMIDNKLLDSHIEHTFIDIPDDSNDNTTCISNNYNNRTNNNNNKSAYIKTEKIIGDEESCKKTVIIDDDSDVSFDKDDKILNEIGTNKL